MNPAKPEYPSLKEAAERASRHAQTTFFYLNVVQLLLVVATALVSGGELTSTDGRRFIAVSIAILMMAALGIATMLRVGKFDDRWFRSRALAENVKTAVWSFVMSPADTREQSEAIYLAQITALQKRLAETTKDVALFESGGPLLTEWMYAMQKMSLADKLDLYLRDRVADQQEWYLRQSQANTRSERTWFIILFVTEFAAVAYAAFQAWFLLEFNAVGALAATSAALIAWVQTKRFSDLAISYGIACGDLRRIATEHKHASNETETRTFVQEVETAISREHALWLSRRIP